MESYKWSFESRSGNTWLIGSPSPGCMTIDFQLQLMVRFRPAWLPFCFLRQQNGPQICYDLTDLQSLESIKPDIRTPDMGKKLLIKICTSLMDASDHLLPLDQFCFDPAMIFLDHQDNLYLVFWPFKNNMNDTSDIDVRSSNNGTKASPINSLISQLGQAFHWDPAVIRQSEVLASTNLSQLVVYLQDEDKTDFCEKCDSSSSSDDEPVSVHQAGRHNLKKGLFKFAIFILLFLHVGAAGLALFAAQKQLALLKPVLTSMILVLAISDLFLLILKNKKLLSKLSSRFSQAISSIWTDGQQENAQQDDDTVLLPHPDSGFRMAMISEGKPGTIEENEGLRAFILVEEFIIGRDPKQSDLCIPDSSVGRQHARILRRAGTFFICDLGSANGTRVDGRRLLKNNETMLPDQCLIEFAEQSFYFQAD